MFDPEQRVLDIFRRALGLEEINEDPALAIKFAQMVVAMEILDHLSHHLCLGIRYGLFGTDANTNSSINELASAIQELAESWTS